jgi:hypothetical protein
MNNYNLYKFKYDNPYYNILIDKRLKMIMHREKLLCKNYRLIATDLSGTGPDLETYTDFIRLAFILGEPFIGEYGYSRILLLEY